MPKKIITEMLEGVGEFVKDSAKQAAETIDPIKIIDQAAGVNRREDELTKYLKDLGGNLTAEELEKKKKEFEEKAAREKKEAEKVIKAAIPAHLRPTVDREPSIFDRNKQEEEIKKADELQAQKKQQMESVAVPSGQQKGILAGKRRKPVSSDFERQKNVKIG